MAQKYLVQVVDDLDGSELEAADVAEVQFGLDGQEYVIDLSKANAFLLRSTLERYADAGRRDQPGTRRAADKPSKPRINARQHLKQVRQWANSSGHTVSNRGRVPNAILQAYDDAH